MHPVILYSLTEDILLDDVTTIIGNLHGDNDRAAVRNSIKNHPNFAQNYQLFVEHLFTRLQTALARHCKQVKLPPVEFQKPKIANDVAVALCNYDQTNFDAIMAMVYLPLNSKYDYASEHLPTAYHTYFLWDELDDDITYMKILELFDFAEQEV